MRPIELEPPLSIAVRFRDTFNAAAARCRQDIRDANLIRDLRHTVLLIMVEDSLDANGCYKDGRLELFTEEFGAQVAVRCGAQHTGNQLL